jgi:hypothetical protein
MRGSTQGNGFEQKLAKIAKEDGESERRAGTLIDTNSH